MVKPTFLIVTIITQNITKQQEHYNKKDVKNLLNSLILVQT